VMAINVVALCPKLSKAFSPSLALWPQRATCVPFPPPMMPEEAEGNRITPMIRGKYPENCEDNAQPGWGRLGQCGSDDHHRPAWPQRPSPAVTLGRAAILQLGPWLCLAVPAGP
jgi:hypothetical protein